MRRNPPTNKQAAYIRLLAGERGLKVDRELVRSATGRRGDPMRMSPKTASKVIDWLLAQPQVRQVARGPTQGQLRYLEDLAELAGYASTREALLHAAAMDIDQLSFRDASRAIDVLKHHAAMRKAAARPPKPSTPPRAPARRTKILQPGHERLTAWRGSKYDFPAVGNVIQHKSRKGVPIAYWTVVDAERPKFIREDAMSFGAPGGMDSGWTASYVVRPATKEEAAPLVQEAEKRRAKAESAKETERKRAESDKVLRKALEHMDYEMSTVGPQEGSTVWDSTAFFEYYSPAVLSVWTLGIVSGRAPVVSWRIERGDDWRNYYFAPAQIAHEWRIAYANQQSITVQDAQRFLAKYSRTHGSDVYEAVLKEAGM